MLATVLNNFAPQESTDLDAEVTGGHWETVQDPDTNAITRIWIEDVAVPQRPGTSVDSALAVNRFDIECEVRGFQRASYRNSANSEAFTKGDYTILEIIQINFPAKYVLNHRQLITNIRNHSRQILWLEEETGQPTVFDVAGVTPTFDPFGRHVDNMAVLRRSAIQ